MSRNVRLNCVIRLAFLIGALVTNCAYAGTIVIDQDTVIDAENSFLNDHIRVVNGPDGPPTITMLKGGEARLSFALTGDATLLMTGGEINGGLYLFDNAKALISGGFVQLELGGADGPDFIAYGSSQLHLYDLSVINPQMRDASTIHLYGRNLRFESAEPPAAGGGGSFRILGRLLNDDLPFENPIPVTLLGQATIVLHNVPEPASLIMITLAVSVAGIIRTVVGK